MFLYSVTVTTTTPSILNLVDLHLSVYLQNDHRYRFSENTWLIYTSNWPNWIRTRIANALTAEDQVLITNVAQPFDGIFNSHLVSWINARLTPYVFEDGGSSPAIDAPVAHH